MTSGKKKSSTLSSFQKIHSFAKLLICIGIAAIVYLIVQPKQIDVLTHIMIGWDTFSLCMIVLEWITFSITKSPQIREQAKVQESSRSLIFFVVLIATLASFLAVLLLLITKEEFKSHQSFHLIAAVAGMVLSWFLIHTIFTLRYAHIYYGDDKDNSKIHAGGLKFPDDEKPDYLDFAYFSFVLGMTFQVSDVDISSKRFRRLAMWHGLLSFGYNTVMIALTINVIAGSGN
jgi:uncharacterized membrane protein